MNKPKTPHDSANNLAHRQAQLLATLIQGIRNGGLTDNQWLKVYSYQHRVTDRGYITPRTRRTLDYFLQYRLYQNPRRLVQLIKQLENHFDKTQRIYTNKNLLTSHQTQGGEKIITTLQDPQPIHESIQKSIVKNNAKNKNPNPKKEKKIPKRNQQTTHTKPNQNQKPDKH